METLPCYISVYFSSLLTLPGSVTLNFSQLSISLPCFQSAEAWVYLDLAVSLALVSVLWWVLKLGVAGDGGIVKTGIFFFYSVEYWPPVQDAKIFFRIMMYSEELWSLHLTQEQDSDETSGEMDRPVFPQSQSVGSSDTTKEREGEILGLEGN